MRPVMSSGSFKRTLRLVDSPKVLFVILVAQGVLACLLWASGSPHGTWGIECSVGALAYDLAHGLNPDWSIFDYFDRWTFSYLFVATLAAPLTWLMPTAYALKLVALAMMTATVLAGWDFVRRVGTPRQALMAAALLAFPAPHLWTHAVNTGDYHYLELLPEFLMLSLLADILLCRRGGRGSFLGLGMASGLLVGVSFPGVVYVLLTLLALLLLKPPALPWRRLGWVLVGALPALALVAWKALVHRPVVVAPGDDRLPSPEVSGSALFELPHLASGLHLDSIGPKLLRFPSDFASNLGFAESAWAVDGGGFLGLAQAIDAVGAALLLGALLAPLGWFRGLLARDPGAWLRSLPALFGLALLGGYLVSGVWLVATPPELAQFLDNRFLPPLIAFGSVGLVLSLPNDMGRWIASTLVVCGLLGQLTLISWADLEPGMSYRGRCYNAAGYFAAGNLPPELLRADVGEATCRGFGERAPECETGWAWKMGQVPDGPTGSLGGRCTELRSNELRRNCYQGTGWTLSQRSSLRLDEGRGVWQERRCRELSDELVRASASPSGAGVSLALEGCRAGLGWDLGGHYVAWPEKFPLLIGPHSDKPRFGADVARGAGEWLGHAYELGPKVERICAELGSEGFEEDSCREGLR